MTYMVHSNGRRDKRNRFQCMRSATRSEISLGCKGWSHCRIIHSCFMNSLLSLGAENLKNVGGHKHKVSDEHVIYLTCSTWQDRLLKKKRQKHMISAAQKKIELQLLLWLQLYWHHWLETSTCLYWVITSPEGWDQGPRKECRSWGWTDGYWFASIWSVGALFS